VSGVRGWPRVALALLRPASWLWPARLRRTGAERDLVLEELLSEAYDTGGLPGLSKRWLTEVVDALGVAARHGPVATPAARGGLVLVTLAGGALLLRGPAAAPVGSVVVTATDAAGEFTLTIERGRLVAASVDRVPWPADGLVQTADSLRVLDGTGGAVVAVEFEAPGTIRWAPRPAVAQ
jgi:hypothetical protein